MIIDDEVVAKSSINKLGIGITVIGTILLLLSAIYFFVETVANSNFVIYRISSIVSFILFLLCCFDFKKIKDETNTELRLTKDNLLILKGHSVCEIISRENLKLSTTNFIPGYTICALFDNEAKVRTFSYLNLGQISSELKIDNEPVKKNSLSKNVFVCVVCLFAGICSYIIPSNSEYNKAINCLVDNKVDEAIVHLDKAVTSCKSGIKCPEYYSTRGHIKERHLKDKEGAFADYKKSLDLFDKLIETKNKPSDRLFISRAIVKEDLSDFQGAINDYDMAIKINPKNLRAYNLRAFLKIELKDYNGALEDFKQIEEAEPSKLDMFVDTYYLRGKAKYELGDTKGAREDYNKAIQLFPDENYKWYTEE